MIPDLSPCRRAALTGAAALLFSFAHVSPAAAQTSTRHAATCTAVANDGVASAECTVTVPPGKVFVIESASFGGYSHSNERLEVRMTTRFGNTTFQHAVPAAFQMLDFGVTWWTGAFPGTIFGEAGSIKLLIWRAYSSSHQTWIRMTLSGRLEDM